MNKKISLIFLSLLLIGFLSFSLINAKSDSLNEFNGLKLKTKFKVIQDDSSINKLNYKQFEFEENDDISTKDSYYIIQFKEILSNKIKLDFENNGVVFYDYIPDNSYIVKINSKGESYILSNSNLNFYSKYLPEYKIDKKINKNGGIIDILIVPYEKYLESNLKNNLLNLNSIIQISGNDRFIAKIDSKNIFDIANLSEVKFIELYTKPELFNTNAREITYVNYIWDNLGFYGEGQKICVADSGISSGVNDATMHDDFEGRLIGISDFSDNGANDLSGHGTHVSGTVLGNGNRSGSNPSTNDYKTSNAGVAPNSFLYFQALEGSSGLMIPENIQDLYNPVNISGIKVHTNSWGDTGCDGDYSQLSADTDEFIWNNQDFLILYAVGNNGSNAKTACPASAKNTLSVGASNSNLSVASFSTRGPTHDLRIKPDLIAPGVNILSTYTLTDYAAADGTSMATPHLAGIVLLVREFLNSTHQISNPSSSLIKALLINGAEDITGTRPDNNQGWGLVSLKNSIQPDLPTKISFYDNSTGISNQDSHIYNFTVDDDLKPLRITLVWTDYPSTSIAAENLVNDLDLRLITPNGSIYNGNDFTYPYNDSKDAINNVERIEILNPQIGDYTLEILGYNIVEGPQSYSLVLSYSQFSPKILSINSPALNVYDSNIVDFNLSLNDFGKVDFSIDNGITNYSMDTFDNLSFNYSLDDFSAQNYNATFYVKDLQDNLTQIKIINFSVIFTPFEIILNSPNSSTYNSIDSLIFNLTLNKEGNLFFSDDLGLTNTTMQTLDDLSFEFNYSNLTHGIYNITFYANNSLGQKTQINYDFEIIGNVLNLYIQSFTNESLFNTTKSSFILNATATNNISYISYQNGLISKNISYILNLSENIFEELEIIEYGKQNFSLIIEDEFGNILDLNYILNVSLNPIFEDDFDGDGINDSVDKLIGNSFNIYSNLENIVVKINSSDNISKIFSQIQNVSFQYQEKSLIEFENNFSTNLINLTNVVIKTDNSNNLSKFLVRGVDLEESNTKTIYFNLMGDLDIYSSLCIRDENIMDFSQISLDCSNVNETYIHSIPYSGNGYTIDYFNSSNDILKIQGLKHSALAQVCTENWVVGSWGTCSNNIQTRTVTDSNSCLTQFTRPSSSQSCTSEPEEEEQEDDTTTASTTTPTTTTPIVQTTSVVQDDESQDTGNIVSGFNNEIAKKYMLEIGRDKGINDNFNSLEKIKIKDKIWNKIIVEFEHDFEESSIDLSNFDFEFSQQNKSYIIVKGLNLKDKTKRVRIVALENTQTVCIKDQEVNSIGDISFDCSGINEYIVTCNSIETKDGYTCIPDDKYYYIMGLKHSAVLEFDKSQIIENSLGYNAELLDNNLETEQYENLGINISEDILADSDSNKSSILRISLLIIFILILIVVFFFVIVRFSKKDLKEQIKIAKLEEKEITFTDFDSSKNKKNDSNSNPIYFEKVELEKSDYEKAKAQINKLTKEVKKEIKTDLKKEKEFLKDDGFSDIKGYKAVKLFVKTHKEVHSKKIIYETLIDAKYPKEIIEEVFKEEYVEE